MRKVDPEDSWNLPLAKLYLDDMEEIIAVLTAPPGFSIELRIGRTNYDSLDEVQSYHGRNIPSLEINGTKEATSPEYRFSSIKVKLSNSLFETSNVNIHPTDEAMTGIAGKIRDIVARREKRFASLFRGHQAVICMLVYFAFMAALYATHRWAPHNSPTISYALLSYEIIGLITFIYLLFGPVFRTVLVLRKQKEGGFWTRNREKIQVGAINQFIGGSIALFFAAVLGFLHPSAPTLKATTVPRLGMSAKPLQWPHPTTRPSKPELARTHGQNR